ncbi:MAG TPA: hypothetical protein EYG37_03170, partial [Candidatus Thioglobus sp.]|nr:hypothetical protein [Candidatus Thioglobus sp.]
MNTQQYIEQLRSGTQMKFSDFIDLIAREYSFSNIAFENSGVF